MDPVSGALAGASLISGIAGGKSAQKSQNKSLAQQKEVAKRMFKLFDTMFGTADDAAKSGAFDADKQIKNLEKDTARYEGEDLGNLAGAARVAGYQPGDSVVTDMLESVKQKYRSTLDNARLALRRGSVFDKLQAYGMAGNANLGTAANIYGQQAQMAAAQQPNLGGLFGTIMPFLTPRSGGGGGGSSVLSGGDMGHGAPGRFPRLATTYGGA